MRLPPISRIGFASNATTGGFNVVLTTGAGLTTTVPPGGVVMYASNGTDVVQATPIGNAGVVPIGSGMDFFGTTAPALWLFAAGQAVSRTTYAALFAVLGTTYGGGDGSTTFNLPDKRGRSSIGKDNMGGAAASRVTAAISGVDGTVLGAAGGNQALQSHNHGIADPGHAHTIADPGHSHSVSDPGHSHSYSLGLANLGAIGPGQFAVNGTSFTSANTTGISIAGSGTGIGIFANTTGISATGNSGSGGSQNLPPGIVCNYIIFAGV